MPLEVIHEDNHLLVVAKPAGLLSQGDASGAPSLVDLARDWLRERYAKPGNVYVGLVHRLDRNASGVVVLARTSKAAGRLSACFRDDRVEKVYLAICEGRPEPASATLVHWLAAACVTPCANRSRGPANRASPIACWRRPAAAACWRCARKRGVVTRSAPSWRSAATRCWGT